MTDEAKKVNEASHTLFNLEMVRHQNAVQEIANMALRVDGVDPKVYTLNLDTMTYTPKA
jgi:hypothetical protein